MNLPSHKIMRKKQSAFTILELLVVIGIIAVLITAGAVSYSTAQKVARDARRLQDLKDIQNAFEQYYSICNYQYGVSGAGNTQLTGKLTCTAPPNPNVDLITYPKDPLGGFYQCLNCGTTAYTVCPPIVVVDTVNSNNSKYLETKQCTVGDPNCCLKNQQ